MTEYFLWGGLAVFAAVALLYYVNTKTPIKAAFKGMASGAAALVALHFFGSVIGVSLPITPFTAAAAVVLGVPGVILFALYIFFTAP